MPFRAKLKQAIPACPAVLFYPVTDLFCASTTPSGFDCSGFTQYVYSKFGISLPRIDYQQRVWAQAHGTKVSDPQPGDLMWRSGHVGIYVGNGLMIHAPRPGKSVSIVPVYASFEYYRII